MTGEICAADAISQRVGRTRLAKRSQILISEPLSPCAVTGIERDRVLRVWALLAHGDPLERRIARY